MVCDVLVDRLDGCELVFFDELVEQLRVVHDFVVVAELWVFVGDCVEVVWIGGYDLQWLGVGDRVERLDVLHVEHLEQELVVETMGWIIGAGFVCVEDGELDVCDVEQFGEGACHFFRVVFERVGTADPEQVFDFGAEFLVRDGVLDVEV